MLFRSHDYEQDEILIQGSGRLITLHNQAQVVNQNQSQMKPNTPVSIVIEEHQHNEGDESTEIEEETLKKDVKSFTRMTEPHKPERVQELLQLITIGDDLSEEEQFKVQDLIKSFADIFALSVSEVKTVDNAIHHLNIPPDVTFPMKVHQKLLTPHNNSTYTTALTPCWKQE